MVNRFLDSILTFGARTPRVRDLLVYLLDRRKHGFITKAFAVVSVDNVTYLRTAASKVKCYKCGLEMDLIDREVADLTFDELYNCPGQFPKTNDPN
jgi:hypothetical protein